MATPRTTRRWIGGIFLAASVVMLILGQTILKDRLVGTVYIRYWLICFASTGTAALVALIDLILVKKEIKEEQQELISETLHEIEDAEGGKESDQ